MTKKLLVFLGAIVIVVAIAGGYKYPLQISQQNFGSPVNTTFNSAKIAAVNMSPATAGATSTSILNTDTSARWFANYGMAACTGVGSSQTFNTGAGLAALTLQVATTSVANLGLQGSTNYVMNLTVSTSTSFSNSATSTQTTPAYSYWAPGTYLTFTFNATNTAACTVEVDYLAS